MQVIIYLQTYKNVVMHSRMISLVLLWFPFALVWLKQEGPWFEQELLRLPYVSRLHAVIAGRRCGGKRRRTYKTTGEQKNHTPQVTDVRRSLGFGKLPYIYLCVL